MNKNKLLLLVSSLGVLSLLVVAAVAENIAKPWRRLQAMGRNGDEAIQVQLRQITNPGLQVADRCVTCHASMAPGEKDVSGAPLFRPHNPVIHDTAEYGCTVCHGGQGLATEKGDAHGDVHFWPQPMIPARHAQAGCGTCHSTPGVPTRASYLKARGTFERLDCRLCHRVDNRGGTVRPGWGGRMDGPDLTRVGIVGYDKGWYDKHTDQRGKLSLEPVSEADRTDLALFLSTSMGAPQLIEAKSTFHAFGCLGCHRVSGVGGDEGPDLTRVGEKDPGQVDLAQVSGDPTLSNWFVEHFRSPVSVVATSQMPPVAATDREIDLLTLYVHSLRRRDVPGSYTPRDRLQVTRLGIREFTSDGATIFGAFCAGCHGPEGNGRAGFPAIANPDFLALASDRFLAETVRKGRPGRRMPGWAKDGGLRPAEIEAVVAHLRSLGGAPEAGDDAWKSPGDSATGKRLFAANCGGCHGEKGEGYKGPALFNKTLAETASDRYLFETINRGRRGTAMPAFSEPAPTHRALARSEIESIVAYLGTQRR